MNWKEVFEKYRDVDNIKFSTKARKIMLTIIKSIFKIFFKLDVIKKDLPKGSKIFAANHVSLLDAFAIVISLTKEEALNTVFISKDRYANRNFIFSYLSKLLGILSVGQNTHKALSITEKALRDGHNLIIFPEGTRSKSGNVKDFKKTFAILSYESKSIIIPIAIEKKGLKMKIDFLNAIKPTNKYLDIANKTKKSITNQLNCDII